MTKTSLLALSTIAVVSFTKVQASLLECFMANQNCSGYFYDDINAAFVDCYNSNGVIVSREESFFTEALAKECNSTSLGELYQEMNNSMMAQPAMNASSNVSFCDYYQNAKGYQFTQADSGIGLIILEDRVGGARDLHYKGLGAGSSNSSNSTNSSSSNSSQLASWWSWNELASLVEAYSHSECSASSGNSSGSNSSMQLNASAWNTEGGNVWANLSLPWSSWNVTAQANQSVSSWSKSDWKFWLEAYIEFYNAYQEYVYVWNNDVNMSSSLNESAGNSSVSFNNSGLALNFSDYWNLVYDLEGVSIDLILADLNSSSNVVSQCGSWFSAYFGSSGFISLNITYTVQYQMTGPISSDLEAIVNYIKDSLEAQISVLCPQCNFTFPVPHFPVPVNNNNNNNNTNSTNPGVGENATNQTGSGSGSGLNNTNGTETNSTGNSSSENNSTDNNSTENNSTSNSTNNTSNETTVKFSASNYSLSSSCSYTNNNQSIFCTEGVMRAVTYSFSQINSYWSNNVGSVCSDSSAQYLRCTANTVITDISTCFRLSLYNQCQLKSTQRLYAWLYFDSAARTDVYDYCQSADSSFSLTSDQFESGFQFAFGTIN